MGFTRVGRVSESLPFRCRITLRPDESAEIYWQTSWAKREASQSMGQNTWTEDLVSVLGYSYHIRAVLFGTAEIRASNPALYRVVPVEENYRWCAAAWFAKTAPIAFINTVNTFKVDERNVPDDF